jgi:molybdopterin-guanine dinucleotide biosynthesis protein A
MGSDKARLLVSGIPLLILQLERLRIAGAGEFLVSVATPDGAGNWPEVGRDVRWVADVLADAGPMAGLEAVLRASASERLLVVAVDLPALDAGFLTQLIGRAGSGDGVVPRLAGRWEPLCALYPRLPALRAAEALATAGNHAVHALVELGVAAGWLVPWDVPPEAAAKLANWNRPEDWKAG